MRKRNILLISILFLVIGFAAVSTALFINGSSTIANKQEDFDVYFSDAYIDDLQSLEIISQDKKTITYETDKLINKNEKSVLDYEVTNASRQYDARVSVNCAPSETDLVKIEASIENDIIEARSKGEGQVIVTLKENTLEEKRIEFSCTLQVVAIERDSIINSEISSAVTIGTEWEFDYSEGEEEFIIPKSGFYKLEVWGAQGGEGNGFIGGYGAYSVGKVYLTKEKTLFINVGGQGESIKSYVNNRIQAGGYNGGGQGNNTGCPGHAEGGGGGATHIATYSGLLSSLEERKEEILIVAGGGGGGHGHVSGGSYPHVGGSGGGIESVGYSNATQTSGNAFGQGYNSPRCTPGGGGGFYGGTGVPLNSVSTAGGSGYVGNPLLIEKSMACYGCTTSNEESTKTISVTDVSKNPVANYAKKENGYAKITYLGKNPSNEKVWTYSFENKEDEFIVPESGVYKLEVWGAQGGSGSGVIGGYGGYSTGTVSLVENTSLFINVGAQGANSNVFGSNSVQKGGYNGGGQGHNGTCTHSEGAGGGATHIATQSGLLSSLENKKDEILIVAGGGGGGHNHTSGAYAHVGGAAGGFESIGETPSTQTNGYAFGQGYNSAGCSPGGGGGFYGGYSIQANSVPAGGGSSYIGNPKLMNKAMYCYNCKASAGEQTKTISVTKVSDGPIANYAKMGNGYAKITYLGK